MVNNPVMAWKLLATTFATVFLAELGDKTQLTTLSLAANGSPWVVFAGSALALIAASAIAAFAGGTITRIVDPAWIRRAAGALFLLLGAYFLITAR